MEALETKPEEIVPSVNRKESQDEEMADDALSAGGRDFAGEPAPVVRDSWEMRGIYLVRVHRKPRTTLFSPAFCEDPIPIALVHLEVARRTETDLEFDGLKRIEDCWSGHRSDERLLRTPGDGRTLTWTGETYFERVMPKPPRGKVCVCVVNSSSTERRHNVLEMYTCFMVAHVNERDARGRVNLG